MENISWNFQVELLILKWVFSGQILISENVDIFQLEDLICYLVTGSDTVFFDFLSMCYFGLGFVYTVEQEAY